MTRANEATVWARAFMDELARAGVRDVCVAPGSRSTPLVLAAARDSRFTLHSILDERSAGFFGLGLGRACRRPAAVITTSGTAGANVFPAVVEASQGDVPLLVLTADRPHRLRDTDGNQSMDQIRLFGTFPRAFFEVAPAEAAEPALRHLRGQADRAVALALGPPPGPVHLNFPFAKPLEPPPVEPAGPARPVGAPAGEAGTGRVGTEPFLRVVPPILEPPVAEVERLCRELAGCRRGVIVAGPVPDPGSVGDAVLALAAGTGFPVLADPLSGARFRASRGAFVVGGYDLFLRSAEARTLLAPDLILRVGASPTSAAVLEYLDDHRDARQIVVDDGHRWKDHSASAHAYLRASPGPLLRRLASECPVPAPDASWRSRWEEAEARTLGALEEGMTEGELLEGEILAGVVESLPEGATLLAASSMPIRDLDAFASPGEKRLDVFGNRGVSGIDGLVSTTAGISAGRGPEAESTPTVAVLGDLAFLHDLNGLSILRALGSWTVLVVVNNDGGGIFHTLPVREHEPHFTPYFATPHGLELKKAAELFQLPYARVDTRAGFLEAFSESLKRRGPAILEVRTRREETHARRRELIRRVVAIMDDLGTSQALDPEDENR